MTEPPRPRDEPLLPFPRLVRIVMYGLTMMAGTMLVFHYGLQTGNEARALTLGFTTFVLFQLFNAVNVRTEDGSAFNRRFFDNPMLWLSLSAVLALQVVVVSWAPAQNLFNVTALSLSDWGLATCTATSVLFFDEIRKLGSRWLRTVTVA